MNRYDVVIAGGGMVGSTLACALGGSELRVALLEGAPLERIRPQAEIDLRVSAITRASQRIFHAVGAWEGMSIRRISPFREMQVWDATGWGRIHFDSADLGEPLLGWIIENRVIQTALLERADCFENVDVLCPAILGLVGLHPDGLHLQLSPAPGWAGTTHGAQSSAAASAAPVSAGSRLGARLLVGADGANSRVRHWAGVETAGWRYEQKAVVATVRTERPHRETAWQRFLPTGPLAFLPLADGRCSIVWSTSPEHAERLLVLDDEAFRTELGEALGWRLGMIIEAGPRGAFPLRTQYAHAYVKPRIALIGDAAHVVHPLAGQGVNLGLLDAAALGEVLLDASAAHRDIGSLAVLRRYERWRKGENLAMLGVMDALKRLFGSELMPVRWLRNAGLNLTDTAIPVKNLIARRAMGLVGDLPRLARVRG